MNGEPATVTDEKRCRGTNADGDPCGVGPELVLDSGFCFSHDAARRSEHKAGSTLGGLKAGSKRRRGLDPDRIGELKSPADAMRITALLTVALATGEMPAPAGRAALVGVQLWSRSYELEQADREVAAIEEQNRLKRGGL